jgi:YD repeat-containing protein
MLRLEAAQWEALRQSVRTRLADTVLEELGRQGVAVQREPSTGELVLPGRSGPPTRLAFAPSGLPTRLTLPSEVHYDLEHDEQGRLAAVVVVYPHGQRVEYERDSRGNVSRLLRPWHRYALAHEAEDRLVEVRWPDGSHTRLEWHAARGVACFTDRMGARNFYERTEAGRLQAVVDALGRRTQFETELQGALQAIHLR